MWLFIGTPSQQVKRHMAVVVVITAALAMVITAWTSAALNPSELAGQLAAALERKATDEPAASDLTARMAEGGELRIGVVAGHSGSHPGYDRISHLQRDPQPNAGGDH
jgi:hypothetical protein